MSPKKEEVQFQVWCYKNLTNFREQPCSSLEEEQSPQGWGSGCWRNSKEGETVSKGKEQEVSSAGSWRPSGEAFQDHSQNLRFTLSETDAKRSAG